MSSKKYLSPVPVDGFPIPERVTEFHEKDLRENLTDEFLSNLIYIEDDENIDEDMEEEKFENNPLIFTDGNSIYRFAEEFPIVVYRCSEKANINPINCLNTFIESITVSTANEGTVISFNENNLKCDFADLQTVVYYTDTIGRNIAIPQYDIIRFLLKKPKLVISNEGLLIFYTENQILTTIDCTHYAWVYDIKIPNDCTISKVTIGDDFCYVYVKNISDNNEEDNKETLLYKVSFEIDMLDNGMITPKVIDVDVKTDD